MQTWLSIHQLSLFANSTFLDGEAVTQGLDREIYSEEIVTMFKANLGLQSLPGSSSSWVSDASSQNHSYLQAHIEVAQNYVIEINLFRRLFNY